MRFNWGCVLAPACGERGINGDFLLCLSLFNTLNILFLHCYFLTTKILWFLWNQTLYIDILSIIYFCYRKLDLLFTHIYTWWQTNSMLDFEKSSLVHITIRQVKRGRAPFFFPSLLRQFYMVIDQITCCFLIRDAHLVYIFKNLL